MAYFIRSFGIVALAVLGLTSGRAQDRQAAFPADTKDAQSGESGVRAVLLEAVCKGTVTTGKEIGCSMGCPDYTGFGKFGDRFPWSLMGVTIGHFLSATSEDAVLSMIGCEPHSMNTGGTILMTKQSQIWSMLWYKAGVDTNECH